MSDEDFDELGDGFGSDYGDEEEPEDWDMGFDGEELGVLLSFHSPFVALCLNSVTCLA